MRLSLSKMIAAAALLAIGIVHQAFADGGYAVNGSGIFLSTQSSPCSGSTVNGCAFVAALGYNSAGQPVAFTSTGNDLDNTHFGGTLREGNGTIYLSLPDPMTANLAYNGGNSTAYIRHEIEAGRPGGAFNTIRTGFYSASGTSTGDLWWMEVQGSTIFVARISGGTWQVSSGALVLDTVHATSTYSNGLLTCTQGSRGAQCSNLGTVTAQFPRNNAAVVTLPNGTVINLQALVY